MKRLVRAALVTGAAFAIPAAVNFVIALGRREIEAALPGESGEYAWPMGRIFYQVRGQGEPVVLVHGIGAGNSSFEWRHNFDALSEHYRVYALDLPGFGKSDRRDIGYTANLYVDALTDFLRDVVEEPAHIVASSLGAAFAVKTAYRRPELVSRLVLVCPTGLKQLRRRPPVWSQLAYGALSLPAIGTSIYNGIGSYGYIESYMRSNLYADSTRVTPALVEHYYQYAHQPGGQYAIRSFISGVLNCDIAAEYPELTQPVLIAWGRHSTVSPVENTQDFLMQNRRARLRVFENSGAMPHDEEGEDFNDAVLTFFETEERAALSERSPVEPVLATREPHRQPAG